MKSSELLIAAKAKIANPENWTKQAFGRDKNGQPSLCTWDNPDIVCFCSLGAIESVAKERFYGLSAMKYLNHIVDNSTYTDVADYNDSHSHAEVMQMFDEAIKLALADEENV